MHHNLHETSDFLFVLTNMLTIIVVISYFKFAFTFFCMIFPLPKSKYKTAWLLMVFVFISCSIAGYALETIYKVTGHNWLIHFHIAYMAFHALLSVYFSFSTKNYAKTIVDAIKERVKICEN